MTSTSSTPDLAMSALSISPSQQQRVHDSYDYDGSLNGAGGALGTASVRQQYAYSTSPAMAGHMPFNPLSMNQSPLKAKSSRAGLPTQWLENTTSVPESRSLSPPTNSDISSGGGSPPISQYTLPIGQQVNNNQASQGVLGDDEVIPNAIVIKNIPFNVKRETLLDIIASLNIPTPYAFNYHLDPQGAFRGLAFANFRQASDADAVVVALNGFDVQGRKLRVEYKKVLQAGEKERIEREKALRRMKSMQMDKEREKDHRQLSAYQEDYGVISPPMFSPPRGFSNDQSPLSNSYQHVQQHSPPHMQGNQSYGVSSPPIPPATPTQSSKSASSTELDLNDPATLEIYSRILLFKDDPMRDELAFSRTLSPKQRRVVHLVAQKLGVYHYSVGEGEERYAVVTRIDPSQRHPAPTLSRAPSAYIQSSAPQVSASSLRTKKSMPDMKTLHTQAPRLSARASNGNIREGYYATISTPSRRVSSGFSVLGNGTFGSPGSAIPPVPSLPANISGPGALSSSMIGSPGAELAASVVRQPRGPSGGNFGSRRDRVAASESAAHNGLQATSHEPLEI